MSIYIHTRNTVQSLDISDGTYLCRTTQASDAITDGDRMQLRCLLSSYIYEQRIDT